MSSLPKTTEDISSITSPLDQPTSAAVVDDSSSRPKPVRKESKEIESALGHRDERKEELLARGVLKDDKIAPALQAQREALRKSQLEDSLESQIKARHSPEELIRQGILNKDEDPTSPV